MLSCKDISKIASEEKPLGLWGKFEFKLHLYMCTYCRFYVTGMKKINEAVKKNILEKSKVDSKKLELLQNEIISKIKRD